MMRCFDSLATSILWGAAVASLKEHREDVMSEKAKDSEENKIKYCTIGGIKYQNKGPKGIAEIRDQFTRCVHRVGMIGIVFCIAAIAMGILGLLGSSLHGWEALAMLMGGAAQLYYLKRGYSLLSEWKIQVVIDRHLYFTVGPPKAITLNSKLYKTGQEHVWFTRLDKNEQELEIIFNVSNYFNIKMKT